MKIELPLNSSVRNGTCCNGLPTIHRKDKYTGSLLLDYLFQSLTENEVFLLLLYRYSINDLVTVVTFLYPMSFALILNQRVVITK